MEGSHTIGAMVNVAVTWAVNTLPDVSFFMTQCAVQQGAKTIYLIRNGCFSNTLSARSVGSTSTEVSFEYRIFGVDGAADTTQLLMCTIQLCMDSCSTGAAPGQLLTTNVHPLAMIQNLPILLKANS